MIVWLLLAALPADRSVLVVGVNDAFEPDQAPLQYADDDAARYYELFSPGASRIELLSILDGETQALFPQAARLARTPDLATLNESLDRLEAAARVARDAGARTELVLIYVGHGRVRGGEGEVKLRGSAWPRAALLETLAQRRFDRVHLVVDACAAYYLVNARGDTEAQFDRFLDLQSLEQQAHVGAVLSTRDARATHEWSVLQGGIFSYGVRSALAGAADVDGSGQVDYVELEAFLAAATLRMPTGVERPQVWVRPPPIEQNIAILAGPPRLVFPAPLAGHFVVEDVRGLALVELHKTAGWSASLWWPTQGVVRSPTGLNRYEFGSDGSPHRLPVPLPSVAGLALARGADRPQGWSAEPLGPDFVAGFRARALVVPASPSPAWLTPRRATALGLGAVAAVAGGLAVWQAKVADARYGAYSATFSRVERDDLADEVSSAQDRALGLGIGAGVAAAAALAFLWWELATSPKEVGAL